jgi:CRISPR-associated protein Cmr6
MTENIGLVFYKTLFKQHLRFEQYKPEFKPTNQNLKSMLFGKSLSSVPLSSNDTLDKHCIGFPLSTVYPGLLLGSGYAHEIGGEKDNEGKPTVENELKLGFFFDYTTGLPCIPGSSIKGVLRSAFEADNGKYIAYIIDELKSGKRPSNVKELADKFDLELVLFSDSGKTDKKGNRIFNPSKFIIQVFDGENQSVYSKDIFLDAFPICSANRDEVFLANDFITHHEHPLKNPNPVQFLKVLPGVTFQFLFRLNDEVMPANLKLEVFKQIILDLGLGAKTNVGYGQFEGSSSLNQKEKTTPSPIRLQLNEGIIASAIKVGDVLDAEIINLSGGITVDLHIKDILFKPRLINLSSSGYKTGQIIKVRVDQVGKHMTFSLAK